MAPANQRHQYKQYQSAVRIARTQRMQLQLLVTPMHQSGYFMRKGLNPQLPRGILSPFSFPQQN
ncbi:MAG: hypothetical protein FRX49_10350 [Trebouxia sp. A1-2]|nr:MAG: hypothetical protein FRX49_10350 [Trebouxia sp. A1-2]